jgi:putative FmdB family regulatory protein
MPKYDFECQKCKRVAELYMQTTQSNEATCSKCGGKMKKLFSPQGTVFQIRWGKPKIRAKVKKMGA